jgi:hypothetical protein
MTNEPSSETHSDKVWIIDVICFNCDKRLTSRKTYVPPVTCYDHMPSILEQFSVRTIRLDALHKVDCINWTFSLTRNALGCISATCSISDTLKSMQEGFLIEQLFGTVDNNL